MGRGMQILICKDKEVTRGKGVWGTEKGA